MLNRIRHRFGVRLLPIAALALGLLPMTGCLVHTHAVLKTRPADMVMTAPLGELLKQAEDRYSAIQDMTASVEIVPCTGGNLQGEVKCLSSLKGYIVISKPDQIHLILLTPLIGTRAIDMVSDGNTFKMLIPFESCYIYGSDQVVNPSQKGLYSLRPEMILDSMLIRGLEPDQIVARTQDIRIVENPKKKKDFIEEPDYDLEFLSQPQDSVARVLHVVHVSRINLLPYQQDIYDADGKIATQAIYSNYQKFGDINFPSKIEIKRPLDALSLSITVIKGTNFNQELDPDAFELGPVQERFTKWNVDDPATAATNPCAAHGTQSPH